MGDKTIVGEAITAHEVPRKVEETAPDIVLIDLKWFGDESAGWSAIKEVKKKHPVIRVIAVTAYENLVRNARLAGADAVLLKTFTKDELVSLVRVRRKGNGKYPEKPGPNKERRTRIQLTDEEVQTIIKMRRNK